MSETKPKRHCRWKWDEYQEYWTTGCGHDWCFKQDGPTENGMRYCHHCGKPIRLAGKQPEQLPSIHDHG